MGSPSSPLIAPTCLIRCVGGGDPVLPNSLTPPQLLSPGRAGKILRSPRGHCKSSCEASARKGVVDTLFGEVLLSLALVSCIRGIDQIFFGFRVAFGI